MVASLEDFLKYEDGVSLTEALLVTPIVLLVFTAFIELGFATFQWNQAVTAMQHGARMLAVSEPMLADMSYLTSDYPASEGGPVPNADISVSCGAGTGACDAVQMQRLLTGSDSSCAYAAGTRPGMCDIFPRITANTLLITYYRSGLGYVGRPDGPVLSITVELRNLTFNFLFLGRFLPTSVLSIPAHPVTITSEDMSSCKNECI